MMVSCSSSRSKRSSTGGNGNALHLVLELNPASTKPEHDPSPAHGVDLGDHDGEGNRRRNVAQVSRVPSRMEVVSRARPASVVQASVGPGSPCRWTDFGRHAQIMIRAVDALEPIAVRLAEARARICS